MKQVDLLDQYSEYFQTLFNFCKESLLEFNKQFHPDLSPMGWHLGHCVFTEDFWIREKLTARESVKDKFKSLYIPANSIKKNRYRELPGRQELLEWAQQSHILNQELLKKALMNNPDTELLKENFLLNFLIQHYAQHFETLQMINAQAIKTGNVSTDNSFSILASQTLRQAHTKIKAGSYPVGSNNFFEPYDNEHPSHMVNLSGFSIAIHPVSNNEYLKFIEAGGYPDDRYWSDAGKQWKNKNKIHYPEYWFKTDSGYACHDIYQDASDHAEYPVTGISFFEAEAFANWAGARLAHEYEWEIADRYHQLSNTGKVWEWCSNSFHPYSGFEAFPYHDYSVPYFDNYHYVLKGGSHFTRPVIKRSTFRNYYLPDKRYQFAGIRLVFS